MLVGYIPIALLGAAGTTALMWSHGAVEALLAAPLGGSLATLAVAAGGYLSGVFEARGSARTRDRGVHARFLPTWTAVAHH
ncbi:hypothetical protein [Methylobacterium planeticum]|uniref:Uncharacterized protein n=1 Tax=Methylobacterium planeticum TaxID=2615211 RepID=A0A6N6MWP4_9HYPH|nr:hypothetical protein [Methylobacterium planeticum]KAB1074310.1 hypothetical protein F6X51_07995 [Methylobacterium planeticum]